MSTDDTELDLIHQAIAGDKASLSQLLLIHYDELRRHVSLKISANLQGLIRPDDVLQQTIVRVAQSIHAFEPRHPGAFRAWLKTIAVNLLKDAEKRRRRERLAHNFSRRPGLGSSTGGRLPEELAGEETSPSGQFQRAESIRRIRIALTSLPADQREAIRQYYIMDRSLDEVAKSMGRTKNAVRGICYRARRNLRAIIGGSSLYFSG